MIMDFFAWLDTLADKKGTLLCVGLDPALTLAGGEDPEQALVDFNLRVIERTHEYALCYKPNIAFYERWGVAGIRALEKTMTAIPADLPVIIDAKRNDIGNTAAAYAESIFGHFKAHAVTVNGYLGKESLDPFLAWPDKGLFVLCRTSNQSSAAIQSAEVKSPRDGRMIPFYQHMAAEAASWGPQIGFVVGGNMVPELAAVRRLAPDRWFLAPGIGAQGGTVAEALAAGARADGKGILPMVARQILEAHDPGKEARRYRDEIRAAMKKAQTKGFSVPATPALRYRELVKKLVAQGCFKTGQFTLKSGLSSPFYLDLRKLISDPDLLRLAADAYIDILRPLSFRRLSAIPVASVPVVTAISLKLDRPMIYPRIPVKDHGSGSPIDGAYAAGEKIVLIDDLITTGLSKVEALDVLRREGLVVEDLVVLVVRGKNAAGDLAAKGVKLHAALSIRDIIDVVEAEGLADNAKIAEIREYLEKN
jgi:uridine monophosphate synthetase